MEKFEFIHIEENKSLMRIDDSIGKGGIEGKVFVSEFRLKLRMLTLRSQG